MVFACVFGLALAGYVLKFYCSSELVADPAMAGPGPLTYGLVAEGQRPHALPGRARAPQERAAAPRRQRNPASQRKRSVDTFIVCPF